ncbi:hypothetical protein [Winogradskyella flava]|uniref:Lipoprotein n=1 Tax=Winogradskyella flava TaxID=1884876 RepID=A0A842IUA6_9FLAO|nr:hypothetical protein [Winogradskyella flava]MBC2846541.1 hypothetical protein [Winogradskyella flava]
MKTKQIKFLSLLLIVLAFGCSSEEMQTNPTQETEYESKNLKTDVISNKSNPDNPLDGPLETQANAIAKTLNGAPSFTANSTTPLPGSDTDVYYLYLNMDTIENEYNSDPNNPSYNGPFNIYYRNLMSNHFTIYHVIESTNMSCGNVERWIVDLAEFNQHLVSMGLPEVDANGNDWYWHLQNQGAGGGGTSTTMLDVNGNRVKRTPPPPPPSNLPRWLVNYNDCFTM